MPTLTSCRILLTGLVLASSAPAPAAADTKPRSALERCVAGALPSAPAGEPALQTSFMLTGDSRVFVAQFKEEGCLGFLAAGSRHVQSLELALRSPNGRELTHSGRPSALAYARHCGVKGEVVYATVRVLDGQGESVYAVLPTDEPRPPAVRALEGCAALGTPRPAPLDVGPEPRGQSIEQQLTAARSELAALGYAPGRLVAYGALHAGEHAANGIVLADQRCYALIAVGSDEVVDLDMRVFGPDLPLTAAGADLSRGRAARVKLCALEPARYVLDVSAFQGEGGYAVAALELEEPAHAPGITGAARIAYAELIARMRVRGFHGRVLTSGVVDHDERLAVPLKLRAGACYALGTLEVSDNPSAGSSLSLGLEAADGALLALDVHAADAPLLFHCAREDESLRALVSAGPGRPRTKFVLLFGQEAEASE